VNSAAERAVAEALPLRPSVAALPLALVRLEAAAATLLLPEPLLSEPVARVLLEPAPLAARLRLPEREAAAAAEVSFEPERPIERLPPERDADAEAAVWLAAEPAIAALRLPPERDALAAALVAFEAEAETLLLPAPREALILPVVALLPAAEAEMLLLPLPRDALTEPDMLVRLDAAAPRLRLPRERAPEAVALVSLFVLAERDLLPAEPDAVVAFDAAPLAVAAV
jgi:hypothetical protein